MFVLNNITKHEDLSGYNVDSLPCPECKSIVTVSIYPDQLWQYNQGALAQVVLADYDDTIRERFITGICNDCWVAMFKDNCCDLELSELRTLDESQDICTDCVDRLIAWQEDLEEDRFMEDIRGDY